MSYTPWSWADEEAFCGEVDKHEEREDMMPTNPEEEDIDYGEG